MQFHPIYQDQRLSSRCLIAHSHIEIVSSPQKRPSDEQISDERSADLQGQTTHIGVVNFETQIQTENLRQGKVNQRRTQIHGPTTINPLRNSAAIWESLRALHQMQDKPALWNVNRGNLLRAPALMFHLVTSRGWLSDVNYWATALNVFVLGGGETLNCGQVYVANSRYHRPCSNSISLLGTLINL